MYFIGATCFDILNKPSSGYNTFVEKILKREGT